MHLFFLDNRLEVSAVRKAIPLGLNVKFIAVTAEAAQYFEELQIPYEPVSKYADTRKIGVSIHDRVLIDSFHLVKEIESFISRYHPEARFENSTFFSSLSHYIFYSVNIVLLRAFLMRETIKACLPDIVTVFNSGVDAWFAGSGYGRQPWYDIIDDLSQQYQFRFEVRPLAKFDIAENKGIAIQVHNRFMTICKSILRRSIFIKKILAKKRLFSNANNLDNIDFIEQLQGLKLLMVQSYGYDWQPVLSALQSVKGTQCFFIEGTRMEPYNWAYYYKPYAYSLWNPTINKFKIEPPSVNEEEKHLLGELFNRWIETRSEPPVLNIMGMNLFPPLVNHLKNMVAAGPALSRYTDALTSQVLDKIKPRIVCFMSMINHADQRLAFECHKRKIPVVCYQHGGGFGVMHCAKDEQTEVAHADYFLTHGKLVQPRDKPAFPIRARYIPVGSTRIESMIKDTQRRIAKKTGLINILWIAETSTRNRLSVPFTLEDTERYLIQKKGLEILAGAKHLRVIFRPVRATLPWEGTTRWLNNTRLSSIKVDVKKPLQDLIHGSDIIISSTASPTTWEEVIGLKKPMILFTKAPMSSYADYFIRDLQKSCLWCRSEQSLYIALRRLVSEGTDFIADLQQLDTTDFIRNYVLYEDDGRCVQRVLSVLKTVCQKN